MLANISVAWVIINMVPFGMALGYAYLPHNKNVHGLLVSLSWTVYAMCAICTRACASRLQPSARGLGGAAASRPAPNLAPPPLPPFTLHALYMPPLAAQVRALLCGRHDHQSGLRQPQVHVIYPGLMPPGLEASRQERDCGLRHANRASFISPLVVGEILLVQIPL